MMRTDSSAHYHANKGIDGWTFSLSRDGFYIQISEDDMGALFTLFKTWLERPIDEDEAE